MFFLLFIPCASGIMTFNFENDSLKYFQIEFNVDKTKSEEVYFILESSIENDSYVTFEKKATQYELTLLHTDAHEIYTFSTSENRLKFTWPQKLINDQAMSLVLKQGTLPQMTLDSYSFKPSAVGFCVSTSENRTTNYCAPLDESRLILENSCVKSCAYYYLIIPFVFCVLGSRFDLFMKLYQKRFKNVYENVNDVETNV